VLRRGELTAVYVVQGERFVLRADYSIYTAFLNDTRSGEYRALTGGLSFFF